MTLSCTEAGFYILPLWPVQEMAQGFSLGPVSSLGFQGAGLE